MLNSLPGIPPRVSFNSDKPWFTAKLRRLRLDKEAAFRSGDRDRFKETKNRFSKVVREANRLYSETKTQILCKRLCFCLERAHADYQLQAQSPPLH